MGTVIKCPLCHIPLCRIEYEQVPVYLCPDCRGSLVDKGGFATIERRRDKQWTDAEKSAIASEVAGGDAARAIACPQCSTPMAKVKLPGPKGPFLIELCKPCGLAWFDRGELEAAQIEYEKEQDAQGPQELAPETRAALAASAFATQVYRDEANADLVAVRFLGMAIIGPAAIPGQLLLSAAKAARWAVENFQEGVDEDGRAGRGHLIRAAIGIALVAGLVAAAWWLRASISSWIDVVRGWFAGDPRWP